MDVKEWRQTRYRAQLWDWGPALCRAKRWRLLFPGVGAVFWGRWCWLAVSGIADWFTECISQSDRCKRIRHVKCHRETGMTQLTGRTDVQLRRAEASTCWCWQERRGTGQGGKERSRGATVVGGVATNKSSLSCSSSAGWKQPSGPASFLFTMVSQSRVLTAPRDGVGAPSVPGAECPRGDLSVWGPVWPRETQCQGHRQELTWLLL